MKTFDEVIDGIILREGGYVDHPSDRGGPTKFGVTETVWRSNGWKGAIRDAPVALARDIYLARYITRPKFDTVHAIHAAVGMELIDTGVLMGPAVPAVFFQRLLNAMNLRGKLFADLFVDGNIGAHTLDAFRAYLKYRGLSEGGAVMVAALNSLQGERFLDIAEHNQSQEDFIYGWIRGRVLELAA